MTPSIGGPAAVRDAGRTRQAELAGLAHAAAAGDQRAWRQLVVRLDGLLRSVVRGYRLPATDVDDVVQTTWLRALEQVHRIKDPAAIAGWLVVTARREAMRTLQRGVREVVTDDPELGDEAVDDSPESIVIARERRAALHGAVARLGDRQRRLLLSMLTVPEAEYDALSAALRMPVGSIGPTRMRALERLRDDADLEEAVVS